MLYFAQSIFQRLHLRFWLDDVCRGHVHSHTHTTDIDEINIATVIFYLSLLLPAGVYTPEYALLPD